jgi:signal transduction histidine kinase
MPTLPAPARHPLLRRLPPGWRRALWLLLLCLAATPLSAQTLRITTALRSEVDGKGLAAAAQTVTLPDEWARTRAGRGGQVWYRVALPPLDTPAGDEPLALFVEHVCSNLEVSLNGALVHSGGRMQGSLTHNCNHPQLVTLPAALLRVAGNTIDIKVAGHRLSEVGSRQRAGGLSALWVGPLSALAPRHARLTAWQVAAPQAVSATLVLIGGFMFVLGLVTRRESHLAYFGALAIGVAVAGTRLWLREPPLGHAEAEFLLCTLLGFITWAAVQFLLRYAGVRRRALDVALPLQCALLAATLVLAGPQHLYAVASTWHLLLALEVLAASAWYLHQQGRQRGAWVMATMLATVALAGGIEFAAQWTGARLSLLVQAAQVAQLLVPLTLVMVALRLVQQHGHAPHRAEQGKAVLEQRVREATAEIERNFRQLAELQIEQVTERERKRIAADLHDDLGAKLLTIVHTSDSERISTLAREALEEMRLSVRGLTGRPVRLADALGDWRAEVVSRLAQAGIEGSWEAPEELPQTLSARAYVQTTRILREATSNIIKHSGAMHCSVQAGIAENELQFVVQDDGKGIADEIDGRLDRGHGLASMKNRAKQLQGQCLVESAPGYGTVIRLTVPLDRALRA